MPDQPIPVCGNCKWWLKRYWHDADAKMLYMRVCFRDTSRLYKMATAHTETCPAHEGKE